MALIEGSSIAGVIPGATNSKDPNKRATLARQGQMAGARLADVFEKFGGRGIGTFEDYTLDYV